MSFPHSHPGSPNPSHFSSGKMFLWLETLPHIISPRIQSSPDLGFHAGAKESTQNDKLGFQCKAYFKNQPKTSLEVLRRGAALQKAGANQGGSTSNYV